MTTIHLDTWQSVLLGVVTVAVALFFIISAAVATAAFVVVRRVKFMVTKAELALSSVESAAAAAKAMTVKAGGPLAMFKIIKGIVDAVNRKK
ncbi:hypothetical protein KC976_03420 [Candidatus Saccharibacteria bacterium]|nr:hypothetical protein [Candidatus Saccharibacteria bacterium]HPG37208.1 hypothetical protein [Candidatus Saccharibacteria bacterium]